MLIREPHLLLRCLDKVVDDLFVDCPPTALEEVMNLLAEPRYEPGMGDPGLLLQFAEHRLLLGLIAYAMTLHQVPVTRAVAQYEILGFCIPADDDRTA